MALVVLTTTACCRPWLSRNAQGAIECSVTSFWSHRPCTSCHHLSRYFLGTIARSMPQFGLLMHLCCFVAESFLAAHAARSMPDAVLCLLLHRIHISSNWRRAILYRELAWRWSGPVNLPARSLPPVQSFAGPYPKPSPPWTRLLPLLPFLELRLPPAESCPLLRHSRYYWRNSHGTEPHYLIGGFRL